MQQPRSVVRADSRRGSWAELSIVVDDVLVDRLEALSRVFVSPPKRNCLVWILHVSREGTHQPLLEGSLDITKLLIGEVLFERLHGVRPKAQRHRDFVETHCFGQEKTTQATEVARSEIDATERWCAG